ncbi:oxidoreductase [Domibacillus robiginosus]|uniref:oxidoreductase n=1 Tax=Domibacillus robiginosus TaxID=1071054 RepID=UPI00067A9386|nr:oxidoreductase [Domibacillus robiginosus]
MKTIGTALIGYGFSGSTFHAPFLEEMEEFQLMSILSSKKEKVKEKFPAVQVVQQVDDIINNPEIELVVVTTPSSLHFEITRQALEAGKHVIVEKPMVPTVEEAEALSACAKEYNVMLSVFQNRRYDGNFRTVKKMIEEGRLGDVYMYEAHYDRFEPVVGKGWREEKKPASGVLYDLGAHLIDQALSLFGMPDSITADLQKQRPHALVDDYFHLVLTYGTKRVILHSGMVTVEQGAKYKVHGTEGTFMKRGEDPQEEQLIKGEPLSSAEWGMDRLDQYGTLYTKEGNEKIVTLPGDYRQYYKGIYHAIRDGQPCPVPCEDGIRTIRIIEAAQQSSREGKTIQL